MKKFLRDNFLLIGVVLLLILRLANVFVFCVVSGESMLPNYKDGEILFATGLKGEIKRGDIIVAKAPNDTLVIKRVIGLPGEHLLLKDGKLFINGEEIKEDYLDKDYIASSVYEEFEVDIPDDSYIYLGDNRDRSYDCRAYGPIEADRIIQKVVFRIT